MVEAPPSSAFVVAEPKFLFEVLVVALDPPAQLGGVYQGAAADGRGQRGQEIFRRLGFVQRPFDQAPFLGARCGPLIIAMRGANTQDGETRCKSSVGSFAPSDPPPGFLGQVQSQLLGRDRLMLGITTNRRRWAAASTPLFGRQGFDARWPQGGGGLDADSVRQIDLGDAVAEVRVVAVARIGQYERGIDPGGNGVTQLIQSDLRLGLEDGIVRYACLRSSGRVVA